MKINVPKKRAGQSGDADEMLRNILLKIRLNEKEFNKIEAKMKAANYKKIATYCRDNLLSMHNITAKNKSETKTELLLAISKIGNNINQIARRLNTIKSPDMEVINQLNLELDRLKKLSK